MCWQHFICLCVAYLTHPPPDPPQLQHSCPPSLPPLTVSIPLLRFSVFQVVCSVRIVLFFSPTLAFFSFLHVLFLVFRIVCLSPMSRQWFYPMVGDIMLFYHRVEPRTGCWRVSASVRTSVSPCPTPINPLGDGGVKGVCAGVLGSAWFWCCWWWWWEMILSDLHQFVTVVL